MSDVLFRGFLEDRRLYCEVEKFWSRYWSTVPCDWKTPWIGTGSPGIWDANPIFSAVDPSERRGLRILQHEENDIVSYLDTFADIIPELVISLGVTIRSMALADSLIREWIAGASQSRMQTLCDRVNRFPV